MASPSAHLFEGRTPCIVRLRLRADRGNHVVNKRDYNPYTDYYRSNPGNSKELTLPPYGLQTKRYKRLHKVTPLTWGLQPLAGREGGEACFSVFCEFFVIFFFLSSFPPHYSSGQAAAVVFLLPTSYLGAQHPSCQQTWLINRLIGSVVTGSTRQKITK